MHLVRRRSLDRLLSFGVRFRSLVRTSLGDGLCNRRLHSCFGFGNLALRRGSALPEARGADPDRDDPAESTPSRQRERSALAQARRTPRPTPPRRPS